MKPGIVLYLISFLAFAAAIFLLISYPNSGRYSMIAGGLTLLGFILNISGFVLKPARQ